MSTVRHDLSWIFNELGALPDVNFAVLLTGDGLVSSFSDGIDRETAERVAASASGLSSLSRTNSEFLDGEATSWQLTMVRYEAGFLLLMAAGHETYLVVATRAHADMELVSVLMQKAVDRLGGQMGVEPRWTDPA